MRTPENTSQCPYCSGILNDDPSNTDRVICRECSKVFDKQDLEKMLLILQAAQGVSTDQKLPTGKSVNAPKERPRRNDRGERTKRPSDTDKKKPTREEKTPAAASTSSIVGQWNEYRQDKRNKKKDSFWGTDAGDAISAVFSVPMAIADIAISAKNGQPEEGLRQAGLMALDALGFGMPSKGNDAKPSSGRGSSSSHSPSSSSRSSGSRSSAPRPSGSSNRTSSRGSSQRRR